MRTRLNFKSAIEYIVRSGHFIYEIKIQERSVFHSFIMLDLDILQLVRQSQIVQDCKYVLSHLLPVCDLLVEGPKITYNYWLSRRF